MTQDINILIIGALIGSLSPLLILLITLYFQNRREVRARQWELEDRQWNKRLSVWDMRIGEARACLDGYFDAAEKLKTFESNVAFFRDKTKALERPKELLQIMYAASKRITSIEIINDPELTILLGELLTMFAVEQDNANELARKVIEKEEIDSRGTSERASEFYSNVGVQIARMQSRLDTLAQTMPTQ